MNSPNIKSKKKILVFCRPYLVEDFKANIDPLCDAYEFRFLTDGMKRGVEDTRSRFYGRLKSAERLAGFSEQDELDVMERCRYLRNLPRASALQMLRSMASILIEELAVMGPDAVLSHMVDDYVTHLLAELTKRRGIIYIGFAYSYFPAKVQVTQFGYGAPFDVREPSDAETQEVLNQISERTFRQNYLQKDTYTRLRHLKAMLRYRVKQVVFGLKSYIENDPLNMHYACLPFVVERRHWCDFPSISDFHIDWRERVNNLDNSENRPIIYFPLSYFPEATIDYWIADRRILQYEQQVLNICHILSSHFRVVVKEHLHMLGARSTTFYQKLRDLRGVVSVPPLEYSNDVLALSDVVLMGAGSIGVEAFIRGKPIVSYCNTSYWFAEADAAYLDLANLSAWPSVIEKKLKNFLPPSDQRKFEFTKQLLRSTMRQSRPGYKWPICDTADLAHALERATQNS